jgi:tryptophan halogenase
MIGKVVVLGGGTAGFLAALTAKVKLPPLQVTVIRSPQIGTIMVGEGSTHALPNYLHGVLRVAPNEFHRVVQPTWKLGIRFLWGSRPHFFYSFQPQLNAHLAITDHRASMPVTQELPLPNGFYCQGDYGYSNMAGALMQHDRVFEVTPQGVPVVHREVAYHIENQRLVDFLESAAMHRDIRIVDDTVKHVEPSGQGIGALLMESGQRIEADLFVDASGFRSVLLGEALKEPFVSYRGSLFCDRAIVGGWQRDGEPVKPYTTAETMEAGWAWQIEHDERINRGYVFSSSFKSDEQADDEFRAKNPRVDETRVVRFVSGRYRNSWVKNVVAIGNSAGFVEPLESTSLAVICETSSKLFSAIREAGGLTAPSHVDNYNRFTAELWDSIRDFLAIHYRFNTRLDTPFWIECRQHADLAGAEAIVDYYRTNGPSILWSSHLVNERFNGFGWDGYLALLVGMGVEYRNHPPIDDASQSIWKQYCASLTERARRGLTVEQACALIRSPAWAWPVGFYRPDQRV